MHVSPYSRIPRIPYSPYSPASGDWDSREVGLDTFPPEDRPPIFIPFWTFRLMVGMGLIMLAVSWTGVWLIWRSRLETTRWFLWIAFLSFPTGFARW